MLCEMAPPSDQLLHTYCTPAPPACGEVVAMVCDEPGSQLSTSGAAVGVAPSTDTSRPAGPVVIVICAADAGNEYPTALSMLISPPPSFRMLRPASSPGHPSAS